jgi:FkbM family methyltransferase
MKEGLLWLIENCSRSLPIRARHLLIKGMLRESGLLKRYGFTYLGVISQRSNIVRVAVKGDYGVFSSSPYDLTILPAYARTGLWSSPMVNRIKAFFAANHGTYLDVGANIGMTLIPIAAHFSQVSCYAFEPEPLNYDNLQRNIAENCEYGNVQTYQLALFDKSVTMQFEVANGNLGDHRLRVKTEMLAKQNEGLRKTIEVSCLRLDDLAISIKQPLLAKIDTQGAEPFVFAGGEKTLAQAGAILFEWCPYTMERLGGDPNSILQFLNKNFAWAEIDDPEGSRQTNRRRGSIGEITKFLKSSFSQRSYDPDWHLDVVVRK